MEFLLIPTHSIPTLTLSVKDVELLTVLLDFFILLFSFERLCHNYIRRLLIMQVNSAYFHYFFILFQHYAIIVRQFSAIAMWSVD